MRQFILLAILCFIFVSARFSCGNDHLQSSFAELLVKNDCKGRLRALDKCCLDHGHCYSAKHKRETCDENFCKCAKEAANKLPLCMNHANTFCQTAKSFGVFNYKGR